MESRTALLRASADFRGAGLASGPGEGVDAPLLEAVSPSGGVERPLELFLRLIVASREAEPDPEGEGDDPEDDLDQGFSPSSGTPARGCRVRTKG